MKMTKVYKREFFKDDCWLGVETQVGEPTHQGSNVVRLSGNRIRFFDERNVVGFGFDFYDKEGLVEARRRSAWLRSHVVGFLDAVDAEMDKALAIIREENQKMMDKLTDGERLA